MSCCCISFVFLKGKSLKSNEVFLNKNKVSFDLSKSAFEKWIFESDAQMMNQSPNYFKSL